MLKIQFQVIPIFFLLLCSCSSNSIADKHTDVSTINIAADSLNYSSRNKYLGISLINDPIRGNGFTDSTGGTKLFINWLKVQLVNDTIIPINVQMHFSNKANSFLHSQNETYKAFLLHDPGKKSGKALNIFLNKELQRPASLNKIIQPGEICIVNVGLLFSTPAVGLIRSELFFKGSGHDLYKTNTIVSINKIEGLELMLGVTLSSQSTYYSTVSCGQILFVN